MPVIGVKGQGIEDVIIDKENGFLVEPHRVQDLVKTIEKILNNKEEARRVGEEGRTAVGSGTIDSWRRNALKWIDKYTTSWPLSDQA